MENLDKKTIILGKILSVPAIGGADDCALMRLARANGASAITAAWKYPELAERQEGLTPSQLWSIAYGWDCACKEFAVMPLGGLDPDWVALGVAAARTCGVAAFPVPETTAADRLVRSRLATVDLGPKVAVPA